jgi:hypothetical protein
MHPGPIRCISAAAVALLAPLMLSAAAANAQAGPQRDFHTTLRHGAGYSGVFPDAALGAGIFSFLGNTRFGVFADGKMTVPRLTSSEGYCPPEIAVCTVEWVQANRNDLMIRDENELLIFNAGGMYAITPEFALMLGAGMARTTRLREYFHDTDDEIGRIGDSGAYFVLHETEPTWGVQGVAGLLFRAGRNLVFRFGYETAPGGMSVGIYWALP